MTDEHFDLLVHSIGMTRSNYRRSLSWWLDNENHRNYYATDSGCDGYSTGVELSESGLMKRGRHIPGGLIYYHVTPYGVETTREEFFKRRWEERCKEAVVVRH